MYSEKVISRKKDLFDNIVTSTKLYRRFNHYMYAWSMTQNHQFILHLTITSNNSSRLTYLLIPVLAQCNHFYYLLDLVLYKVLLSPVLSYGNLFICLLLPIIFFFLCNHTIWISGLCIIKKTYDKAVIILYSCRMLFEENN